MSTRALRKLQREQELEKQLAAAKTEQEETEESEEEEVPSTQPKNAFDMLDAVDEDEESEDQEEHPVPSIPVESSPTPHQSSQSTKAKKKKKKAKKKSTKEKTDTVSAKEESEDEIDRALKELAAKNKQERQDYEDNAPSWEATATQLLAIDQKALNPTNEMRSLFGNIAIESNEPSAPSRTQRRRQANLQGGVDLETALTGRHSMASRGKELGALANRRNVFMQGRSEWPLAASGGLSMENVPSEGFEKRYNIVHNRTYEEVQMHFRIAVESMQADRMIGLLMANPYHIATLLQVSEIAKHQGDHSVSGDLLERALFSIGRSVHSSFPAALREGKARLAFDKPANRELYLTVWRYIRNLEQRGTWRTAFEWAKMLLQFDTQSDPYGVTLMIDQFALRGRQHAQLIEMASDDGYGNTWKHLPNIQISLALAYQKSKRPRDARRQLAIAMHNYPYILSALASALEISPLPKTLWAKLPSTDAEKLYTELYVTRAKDLWNTPETTALIDEVAQTLTHYTDAINSAPAASRLEVSLEEARHVMLLEIPALIALLPRSFTNMPTSSSDVLPPPTSLGDFTARAPTDTSGTSAMQALLSAAGSAAGAPIQGANSVFQRILNWFHAPAGPSDATDNTDEGRAAFQQLREQLGGEDVSDEMIEQMLRLHLHDDEEEEGIIPSDLGMAGGWNDDDEDEDEIPDLAEPTSSSRSPPAPIAPANPLAARVEEGDSDEDTPQNRGQPSRRGVPSRAILRRVESDDEQDVDSDGIAPHPEPTHTLFGPAPPTRRRTSGTTNAAPATQQQDATPTNAEDLDTNDPQRIQRWLLAAGLQNLRADPTTNLPTYVSRMHLLRKQQQDWILNIITQQGGKELGDRVRSAL